MPTNHSFPTLRVGKPARTLRVPPDRFTKSTVLIRPSRTKALAPNNHHAVFLAPVNDLIKVRLIANASDLTGLPILDKRSGPKPLADLSAAGHRVPAIEDRSIEGR